MPDQIRSVEYFHATVPDKPGEAARVLNALRGAGISLLGVSAFPKGINESQLDLITEDSAALCAAAKSAGVELSTKKRGFFIQGEDRPGAVVDTLDRLAREGINVISVQAVCAGGGRYGALLWVKPSDIQRAARALDTAVPKDAAPDFDVVDEASKESFPASDPPPWTL